MAGTLDKWITALWQLYELVSNPAECKPRIKSVGQLTACAVGLRGLWSGLLDEQASDKLLSLELFERQD